MKKNKELTRIFKLINSSKDFSIKNKKNYDLNSISFNFDSHELEAMIINSIKNTDEIIIFFEDGYVYSNKNAYKSMTTYYGSILNFFDFDCHYNESDLRQIFGWIEVCVFCMRKINGLTDMNAKRRDWTNIRNEGLEVIDNKYIKIIYNKIWNSRCDFFHSPIDLNEFEYCGIKIEESTFVYDLRILGNYIAKFFIKNQSKLINVEKFLFLLENGGFKYYDKEIILSGKNMKMLKKEKNVIKTEMTHFIAIIEEGDEAHAAGVWFPDLPGCFSAGDTLDEALLNAPEALRLHIESLMEDGADIPSPRSLSAIKADAAMQEDLANYMVAVIPLTFPLPPRRFLPAAE